MLNRKIFCKSGPWPVANVCRGGGAKIIVTPLVVSTVDALTLLNAYLNSLLDLQAQ